MNIRFFNGKVLTMKSDCTLIDGEVWVKDNKISFVGEKKEKEGIIFDREIDLKGNLIMPGFKNAHTHSGMTFLRSFAEDMPLQDWLTNQIFPMEAKLTPDHIYLFSKIAIMEYLTSGITANFDMYLTPDTIAAASADCGFRTVMVGGLNNYNQSVPELEAWYKKYNNYNDLISFQLGFHGEYTTSKELLEELSSLAKQYKAPVYTHNSETKHEVLGCEERYGKTPTVFLNQLGLFDYGGGGYHCVHMTDEDLQIFKDKNLSVITNPGSNTKLASGIAPIQKMLDSGINLAIGTDGPASNNCLDMFREMFLTTGLAKLKENNAAAVDANRVMQMATVGGAKAMCLPDCDSLEEGKLADLIVIDLHQPNMQPINNIVKNIVFSGSKSNVKLTMVNGKILFENGEFYINEDPEEIYTKANELVSSLKNQN